MSQGMVRYVIGECGLLLCELTCETEAFYVFSVPRCADGLGVFRFLVRRYHLRQRPDPAQSAVTFERQVRMANSKSRRHGHLKFATVMFGAQMKRAISL